jgi:outer membrane protein, multidrug efflux system
MSDAFRDGRRRLRAAPLFGAMALLAGCQTPPSRPPPAPPAPLPASFHGTLPPGSGGAAQPISPQWWNSFGDPILTQLETRTLDANYDLRQADARLREARARWLEADSGREPSVGAGVEYRRQHQPPLEKSKDPLLDQYFVSGFDASWEADLFGRVRKLAAAAQADAGAQVAARNDLAITLTAEVARNYFELRGQQESLAAMRRSCTLSAAELELTRRRVALGAANSTDVAGAQQSLDARTADCSSLRAAGADTITRLSLLTAQPVATLRPLLATAAPLPAEPAAPVLGTPADLLRARPDIRQAEQELVASAAVVDAARADLLPRLTFNGQLSFYAFGWGVGPNLTWDVFDRRRVRARQAQAGARADAAFARYQQTVLAAVADVETALTNLAAARDRRDALKSAWQASTKLAADISARAQLGVANRFDVVAAERAEADAAGGLALQEAAVREAWVAVIKALGGGWPSSVGDPTPPRAQDEEPAGGQTRAAGVP